MVGPHTLESTHTQQTFEKSTNTTTRDEESKPAFGTECAWQCGEPYRFPLPAPEGDPWQIVLTPILEKDKARCDAWKDEVQNLLIFAGLFSAVVTAFVIETYKGLQQDPSDTMIALLSRIADDLGGNLNNSSEAIPTPSFLFSPSSSIVRINIFMFVSLILSLATVLIGIISLQWLREHQVYKSSFTPQNTFAAVRMRTEALEKWRVPEIFSALPLILQSALILFFIGIIDFLLSIDDRVAIPVAAVIGATLVFLLFTTMLPTLQAFVLHHPTLKLNAEIPVQCPYKSPQSRAFRRLITSSKLVFCTASLTFAMIYWVATRICLLPSRIMQFLLCQAVWESFAGMIYSTYMWSFRWISQIDRLFQALSKLSGESWDGFDYMTHNIYDFWSLQSSFDFDLAWLSIRDNYFQSTCSHDSCLYQERLDHEEQGAVYDAVLGLYEELMKDDVNMNSDYETPIFTVYQCALDSSTIDRLRGQEQIDVACNRNAYVTTLLGYDHSTLLGIFPDVMQHTTVSILSEEKAFVLLHFAHAALDDSNISSPRLSKHLAEVTFRLLGYLYSNPQLTHMPNDAEGGPPEVPFSADELYVMKIFDNEDQPFTAQWALTIDLYFRAFGDPGGENVDFSKNFHSHPFNQEYIWNFWKEVDHEFSKKLLHPDTLDHILRTFRHIANNLDKLLNSGCYHTLDCMFYPAAVYAQSCRQLLPDHETLNEAIDDLVPTLKRCSAMVSSRGAINQPSVRASNKEEYGKMVLFSGEWWDILFSSDRTSRLSQPMSENRVTEEHRNGGTQNTEFSIDHSSPIQNASRHSCSSTNSLLERSKTAGRNVLAPQIDDSTLRLDSSLDIIVSDRHESTDSPV